MNGYVGEGLPCPYMYLWNPIDVGACAAYAIQAFIDGATTGAVGETYTAGNGSTYEVIEKDESVGVYTPKSSLDLPSSSRRTTLPSGQKCIDAPLRNL